MKGIFKYYLSILLLSFFYPNAFAQFYNERCIYNTNAQVFNAMELQGDSMLIVGIGVREAAPTTQKFQCSLYNIDSDLITGQLFAEYTDADYFMDVCGPLTITYIHGYAAVGTSDSNIFLAFINSSDSVSRILYYSDSIINAIDGSAIIQLQDSSFVIGGWLQDTFYNTMAYATRIDKNGNQLWKLRIPSGNSAQKVNGMMQLADGKIYLFVLRQQNLSLPVPPFWIENVIYEIDTSGNITNTWVKNDSSFAPSSLIRISDGYIYSSGKFSFVDSSNFVNQWGHIARLDMNFNTVWQTDVGIPTWQTFFYKCKALHDGQFLAVGATLDSTIVDSLLTQSGWLVKFDSNGNVIWQRKYCGVISEQEFNHLYDFVELNNGDIIACGESINTFADSLNQQGWLLRVDSFGCLIPGCQNEANIPAVIGTSGLQLHAYPNPSSSQLYFTVNGSNDYKNLDIRINDLNGSQIKYLKNISIGTTYIINTSVFSQSLYLIQLLSNDQVIESYKIVKQ